MTTFQELTPATARQKHYMSQLLVWLHEPELLEERQMSMAEAGRIIRNLEVRLRSNRHGSIQSNKNKRVLRRPLSP